MKSLVNFRDLGGIKAADGQRIKPGRLLRSGEIVGVREEDIERLKEAYDLRCIVDLRSEGEAERSPDQVIDGVEYINILLHQTTEAKRAQAAEEKEFRQLKDSKKVESIMVSVYENLITSPFALGGFTRFIEIVKNNRDGSIIFHCFAGKDRTGVAAAILLTILGVEKEEIMDDYLLTNELRREKNREILAAAKLEGKTDDHLAALAVSYEVRPSYMEKVFEIAERKCGSLLEYIKRHMNVTDADIEDMRANYLER